jgi:O-methyltransferase
MNDTAHISPLFNKPPVRDIPADLIPQVIAEVRPYTMVPDEGLRTTIELTLDAIKADIPGELVECGTWFGGASFAMLLAQKYYFGEIRRRIWMYDSFQGMGEITALMDGEHARWWKARSLSGAADPDKQDYCIAPLDEVRENVAKLDLQAHVVIHPGWLENTLPNFKPAKIAVFRIDCDWYEPVKCCLDNLAPRVSVGGPIILDDYGIWEGCTLATHEYLGKHRLPWKICSSPNDTGVWMIKGKETW